MGLSTNQTARRRQACTLTDGAPCGERRAEPFPCPAGSSLAM